MLTLNICKWTWNINEWAEFSAVWPITSNSKAKQVGFLLQSPCYTCCLEGMNSHTHTRTHARTHAHTHAHTHMLAYTQLHSTICCRLARRPAIDSELWNRNKSLWAKEAEEPWRKHFCWRAWNNPWRAPVTGSRIQGLQVTEEIQLKLLPSTVCGYGITYCTVYSLSELLHPWNALAAWEGPKNTRTMTTGQGDGSQSPTASWEPVRWQLRLILQHCFFYVAATKSACKQEWEKFICLHKLLFCYTAMEFRHLKSIRPLNFMIFQSYNPTLYTQT